MPHPLEVFKILSDATRLTIVMLLREQGELCVCDICALTAESQPKISRHMAMLRTLNRPNSKSPTNIRWRGFCY